jgi:hypothetical protein
MEYVLNNNPLLTSINNLKSSREATSRINKRKSNYVKLVKKINPDITDTLEVWRDQNITDIIPKSKLNAKNENDIVHFGELNKYIQDENNMNGAYTPTFAIVTKCDLTYIYSNLVYIRQRRLF